MGSRCEVGTRMETPHMGLSDGNPSYGSVTCYTASQLRPGRLPEQVSHLSGCTHVCIYACTYIGAFVCVCVGVDWVKIYGYRGSQGWKKKGPRIDIAKWMYAPRDCVCAKTRENNLLMTSSVRHINDTNYLRVSDPWEFGYIKNFDRHNIQTRNCLNFFFWNIKCI